MTETLAEFRERMRCAHISYEDVERWYWEREQENVRLQGEILACHALLDERGYAVGSEFHNDLKRRVEWLTDSCRMGPKLRIENERLRHEWSIDREAASVVLSVVMEIGEILGADVNKGECGETLKAANRQIS